MNQQMHNWSTIYYTALYYPGPSGIYQADITTAPTDSPYLLQTVLRPQHSTS